MKSSRLEYNIISCMHSSFSLLDWLLPASKHAYLEFPTIQIKNNELLISPKRKKGDPHRISVTNPFAAFTKSKSLVSSSNLAGEILEWISSKRIVQVSTPNFIWKQWSWVVYKSNLKSKCKSNLINSRYSETKPKLRSKSTNSSDSTKESLQN